MLSPKRIFHLLILLQESCSVLFCFLLYTGFPSNKHMSGTTEIKCFSFFPTEARFDSELFSRQYSNMAITLYCHKFVYVCMCMYVCVSELVL